MSKFYLKVAIILTGGLVAGIIAHFIPQLTPWTGVLCGAIAGCLILSIK